MNVTPFEGRRLLLDKQFTLGEPATAEAIESLDPDNHPNFIESNTQAVTLEELSNNLIPTWADNSLTISHTNFIKTVRAAAEQVFGNLTPVEIRTSHPIQGRRPEADVFQKTMELFTTFNPERENILTQLGNLQTTRMTEQQFCNIIGRMRLYQALPIAEQHQLPPLFIGDQAVNEATRGYFNNPNFCKREGEDGISCWNFLQLLTESVKSSYIDKFAERNQNAVDITLGLQNALNGNDTEGYSWFLS